jgi:F0F1-type ATP synthase membrane subunit b/b'
MRRNIQLGDVNAERAMINELLTKYHSLMGRLRQEDQETVDALTKRADQIRHEIIRRIDRLPQGLIREHLTRRLYEG